jgi:hypothetical protein
MSEKDINMAQKPIRNLKDHPFNKLKKCTSPKFDVLQLDLRSEPTHSPKQYLQKCLVDICQKPPHFVITTLCEKRS